MLHAKPNAKSVYGQYIIIDISFSVFYFLRDKYSHKLKRLVPPNQLVRYYGVGGFCKPKVEGHDDSDNLSDVDMNSSHIPQPK